MGQRCKLVSPRCGAVHRTRDATSDDMFQWLNQISIVRLDQDQSPASIIPSLRSCRHTCEPVYPKSSQPGRYPGLLVGQRNRLRACSATWSSSQKIDAHRFRCSYEAIKTERGGKAHVN